jgi:hypothetical protein
MRSAKMRRRAKRNPPPSTTGGKIALAVGALALGAGAGAILGSSVLAGVMITGGAGLVTAALSPKWREAGITTAGLGLGAILVIGVASAVSQASVKTS